MRKKEEHLIIAFHSTHDAMAFEEFCKSVGLTVSAAMNMFAKITLRENRIPFEINGDPFWSEENQTRLRESIK